jgi:hypothetical protein
MLPTRNNITKSTILSWVDWCVSTNTLKFTTTSYHKVIYHGSYYCDTDRQTKKIIGKLFQLSFLCSHYSQTDEYDGGITAHSKTEENYRTRSGHMLNVESTRLHHPEPKVNAKDGATFKQDVLRFAILRSTAQTTAHGANTRRADCTTSNGCTQFRALHL